MDTAARLHGPNFRSATHKPLLRIRGIFSHQYKLIAAPSFQRTTNWAQCQCRSDPAIGRPSIGAVAMVHGSCRLRWRGGSWVQHNRSGRSARIAFCSLLIGKLHTQRADSKTSDLPNTSRPEAKRRARMHHRAITGALLRHRLWESRRRWPYQCAGAP
jgi:hypothetical protein